MSSPTFPSEIDEYVGPFDRFAGWASAWTGRAPFFAGCVLLVVVWAPSIVVLHDLDVYQLLINTATTIITFLLVSLMSNSQARSDAATQHKLNAIAEGLADVLDQFGGDSIASSHELRAAVGLEDRETSDQ